MKAENLGKRKIARRKGEKGASAGQIAKSEAMRLHVLETTVECLAARPASEVSVALIAKQAGVSRGGMQYHFPTRTALLQATVDYLHQRRLTQFRADLEERPHYKNVVDYVIDTHWRHLNERDFRAYQELVLAARSDQALGACLTAKYRRFLEQWQQIAYNAFGWRYTDPEVARAGNIAHYILEGMAYGKLAGQLDDSVIDELLDYVKATMRQSLAD